MRKRFLARILVPTSAVLGIGSHRGVVVSGDALNVMGPWQANSLVWPRRVAHKIAEVIGAGQVALLRDGTEYGLQRRKVRVYVRKKRKSRHRK